MDTACLVNFVISTVKFFSFLLLINTGNGSFVIFRFIKTYSGRRLRVWSQARRQFKAFILEVSTRKFSTSYKC